jgi:hypothetical protein
MGIVVKSFGRLCLSLFLLLLGVDTTIAWQPQRLANNHNSPSLSCGTNNDDSQQQFSRRPVSVGGWHNNGLGMVWFLLNHNDVIASAAATYGLDPRAIVTI